MKKRLFFAVLAILSLLYLVAGFWLLPSYATKTLGPKLSELLGVKVESGEVRFNPLTFELTVPDFVLYDKNGSPLLRLGALYADFSPLESLLERAPTLQALRLRRPKIRLLRDENGTLNIEPLLERLRSDGKKPARTAKKSEGMPKVRVGRFAVESASVTFMDRSTPAPARFVATNLNFGVENLSTLPGDYGFTAYEIETEEGMRVRSFAKIALNPLLLRGFLQIRRLDFARYNPYLAKIADLSCKEGRGDLFVRFEASQTAGALVALLREGRLSVDGLRLNDALGTPLKVGAFAVTGIEVRWPERSVRVRKVSLTKSGLSIAQNAKGAFSFQKWAKSAATSKKSAPPAVAEPAKPWRVALRSVEISNLHTRFETPLYTVDADHNHRIDDLRFDTAGTLEMNLTRLTLGPVRLVDKRGRDKPFAMQEALLEKGYFDLKKKELSIGRIALKGADLRLRRDRKGVLNLQRLFAASRRAAPPEKAAPKKSGPPFVVSVKRLEATGARVRYDDRALAHPAKLAVRKIALRVDDFRYPQKKSAPFRLSLQTPGGGKAAAKGRFLLEPLKADLTLNADGAALKPYVPFVREFVNLDVPKGRLTTRARVRYDARKTPKASVDYRLRLENLRLDHAIKKETLFTLERLDVGPAKLQLMPGNLKIDRAKLTGPYVRVHIAKDRATNFDGLIVPRKEKTPQERDPAAKQKRRFGFFLTKLTVEKGRSDFSDLSLPLPFETHIHDLEGEALGLGSEAKEVSSIRLKGIVDKYGMADIRALLLPADPLKKSEIRIDFRNLDVTNLSPYTGKYLGYAIKDGRLWMKLKYEIDAGKLRSDNKIVLKKLELGEKIESNESIDAPIRLALALLKDSDGVVDLEIPVEGNVTDPRFRLGKVVWQAVGNMITGIVTAPFRFLGGMLGIEGEELQYVDFEPGSAVVDPTELEKLDKIVQIFKKRPLLTLKLKGVYHQKADTRGLREAKLRKILVQKANLAKADELERTMTRRLLEELYRERAGGEALEAFKKRFKERKKKSDSKSDDERAYIKELYGALMLTVPVERSELAALGESRARNVADRLQKAGIAEGRIVVLQKSEPVTNLTETGLVPLKLALDAAKK